MSHINTMYPDLEKMATEPTRGTATLDYVFANFNSNIQSAEVCFPIERDQRKSDHNLVNYNCLLERPATFAWVTQEYLKVTPKGTERFESLIKAQETGPQ